MPRVFLSYGREDVETARRLHSEFLTAGVDVWVDFANLLPGQNWRATATDAIRHSEFVVVLLSRSATARSGFLHREIREALSIRSEMPGDRPFLIPLRIDDCDVVHPELHDIHWVDLFTGWREAVEKVLAVVVRPTDVKVIRVDYLITVNLGTSLKNAVDSARSIPYVISAELIFGESDILVAAIGPPTAFEQVHERLKVATNALKITPFFRLGD